MSVKSDINKYVDVLFEFIEDLELSKEEEEDLVASFVAKRFSEYYINDGEVDSSGKLKVNSDKDYYYCSKKVPLSLAYTVLFGASDEDS
ncbi:hypothetical protein N9W84_01250 [bacterium]|nr:hypothetical protein [bacterium]